MNITAICPNCGTTLIVQAARCIKCGRTIYPGEYVIAPAGSIYEGEPVCRRCIDAPLQERAAAGPSEVKEG